MKKRNLDALAVRITEWIGTPQSIVVHTVLFAGSFATCLFGVPLDEVLLLLTTVVSLEAIYLSLLIQLTVNRNTASLEAAEDDIEEIQEHVEDIQEDVEDIQEDLEEIQAEETVEETSAKTISMIEQQLQQIMKELAHLKNLPPKSV